VQSGNVEDSSYGPKARATRGTSTRWLMAAPSQGAEDPAPATPPIPPIDLRASTPRGGLRRSVTSLLSPRDDMSSQEKDLFKAKAKADFDAKAKEAKSKAGTEEGSDLPSVEGETISFDQALLFDEGMLNSWFQEDKLPIRDRAFLLEHMRQFKDSFAHQSTEAIESELTTKMLFDALLFAVAFTVPTGVDRAEMQDAWMADDALYNVSQKHLGNYDVILLVMTYLVTTSTGVALIVGFTIYGCLHSARPSSIVEADRFYARFKVAFRLSYGFTYAAILLAPFSCFELHLIKSPSEPTHLFFSIYGFIIYGLLVVFLAWSLYAARRWKAELEDSRAKFKKQLLGRPLYTPRGGLTSWLSPRGPKTASPTSEPNASTTEGNSM
jgi:hypothetical protein